MLKSFVQLHFEPLCRLSDVLVPLAPPVHIFRKIRFVHHEDCLAFLYLPPKYDQWQDSTQTTQNISWMYCM